MTSQTDTVTLANWLLACIAEDEAVARAVLAEQRSAVGELATAEDPWPSESAFAERFTAARVLAECEAKRKMLDYAFTFAGEVDGEWGDGHSIEEIRAGRCEDRGARAAEAVLSKLALPYADHPDYREAWRP